jgi:hypothetical protein
MRRLLSITDNYQAHLLWEKGFKGQHVKVAIFDTGAIPIPEVV